MLQTKVQERRDDDQGVQAKGQLHPNGGRVNRFHERALKVMGQEKEPGGEGENGHDGEGAQVT